MRRSIDWTRQTNDSEDAAADADAIERAAAARFLQNTEWLAIDAGRGGRPMDVPTRDARDRAQARLALPAKVRK